MNEILGSERERSLTAEGRFFMPVERPPQTPPAGPTREQMIAARDELNALYSGEDQAQAEARRIRGRDDVARGGAFAESPDAQFYIHTEVLMDSAYRLTDQPTSAQ